MPSGEPVYPPPPQLLLYPMRRLMTYKGEVFFGASTSTAAATRRVYNAVKRRR